MQAFKSWRWSALAVAFGLAAPTTRADRITPDSISNPPPAVGSANGTPIYANNIVTTQYAAAGLELSDSAAITRLNGISLWAPIGTAVGGPVGAIDYAKTLFGRMVALGTLKPTTVSSLSVDIVGLSSIPRLGADGLNGSPLNIVPVLQSTPGPDGGQVWTFTGPGLSAFWVSAPLNNGAWGISEVSFAPASTPEPSSLILAGLGALGMVARRGWQRSRRVA